jgi:hypothetical protein
MNQAGSARPRDGVRVEAQGRGIVMEVRKKRLTLGRLMAVIGIVALGFAMSRVDAAPAVSVCVFAACTWYLAARRYAEALGRHAEQGIEGDRAQRARIVARCAVASALLIGLPDAAFLAGYYGYMAAIRATIYGADAYMTDVVFDRDLEPQNILLGALVGIAAALYVAAIMRRGSRAAARKRRAKPAVRGASEPAAEDDGIAPRRGSVVHRVVPH